MLMERRVEVLSLQDISGASQQNSAEKMTSEVDKMTLKKNGIDSVQLAQRNPNLLRARNYESIWK